MGFYAFGTKFQSQFFAKKDISWRVRKPNAKHNRFQIVTIFFTFFFSIFLRHSRRFWQSTLALILGCHGRIQRGNRGSEPPPPPFKNHKNRVSKQYWSRSPENHKLPSQHSMLGHYRPASETRFAGGLKMVCL